MKFQNVLAQKKKKKKSVWSPQEVWTGLVDPKYIQICWRYWLASAPFLAGLLFSVLTIRYHIFFLWVGCKSCWKTRIITTCSCYYVDPSWSHDPQNHSQTHQLPPFFLFDPIIYFYPHLGVILSSQMNLIGRMIYQSEESNASPPGIFLNFWLKCKKKKERKKREKVQSRIQAPRSSIHHVVENRTPALSNLTREERWRTKR